MSVSTRHHAPGTAPRQDRTAAHDVAYLHLESVGREADLDAGADAVGQDNRSHAPVPLDMRTMGGRGGRMIDIRAWLMCRNACGGWIDSMLSILCCRKDESNDRYACTDARILGYVRLCWVRLS